MCRGSFFVAPERRSVRGGAAPHKGRPAFGSVSGKTKGISDAPYSYFLCRRPVYPEYFQGVIAKHGRAGSEKGVSVLLQLSRNACRSKRKPPRLHSVSPAYDGPCAVCAPGSPPRVGRPSAAEDVAVPDADHKAAGSREAAARKKREKAAAAKTPAPHKNCPGKKRKTLFSGRIFHFCGKNLTLCFICLYFLKNLVHLLYLRWN